MHEMLYVQHDGTSIYKDCSTGGRSEEVKRGDVVALAFSPLLGAAQQKCINYSTDRIAHARGGSMADGMDVQSESMCFRVCLIEGALAQSGRRGAPV